jgi:WD40 repeat protein
MQEFYNGYRTAPRASERVRASACNLLAGWAQGLPLVMRHHESVKAVALSADGKTIATASDDKTVRLWCATSGRPKTQAWQHVSGVGALAFRPDDRAVLAGCHDGALVLWSVATGTPIWPHSKATGGAVTALAFSPDGAVALTGSEDGKVMFWAAAGEPLAGRGPLVHDAPVNALAVGVGPDKKTQLLLTGCGDLPSKTGGYAQLWDMATGTPIGERAAHDGPVTAVALSHDGRMALTGSSSGSEPDSTPYAQLWDVQTPTDREPGKAALQPHAGRLRHSEIVTAVAFDPRGEQVVTSSGAATQTWSVRDGGPVGAAVLHEGQVAALAIGPTSRQLTAINDPTHHAFQAEFHAGAFPAPRKPFLMHDDEVSAVAFSADGTLALTAGLDSRARIWDAATGKLWRELANPSALHAIAAGQTLDDQTVVLTGGSDGEARLWTLSAGHTAEKLFAPEFDGYIRAVALGTRDGQAIALAGSDDKTARLWDANTGRLLRHIAPSQRGSAVEACALGSDGRYAATGCRNGAIGLWSVPEGREIWHQWNGNKSAIHALAFSPDGGSIATGGEDRMLRFWDASTGQPLQKPEPIRHDHPIWGVAFRPDGLALVSGCGDATGEQGYARLWDALTGQPLGPALPHPKRVNGVAFNRDCSKVLTGAANSQGRLWDVPSLRPANAAVLEAWFAIRVGRVPGQRGIFRRLTADEFFADWRVLDAGESMPR